MSNPLVENLIEEKQSLGINERIERQQIAEERSLDASEKEQWDKMNDRMSEIDSSSEYFCRRSQQKIRRSKSNF